MKKLFLLLAMVGLLATACEGGLDNEENGGTPSAPKIGLSQQSIDVEFEPGTYTVEVSSPYYWEATSKSSWITIVTESGIAGTKTLKFSVQRNEEEEIREGAIVVKNEDYNLIAELYVIQKAFEPAITINPEVLNFTIEGGIQEVAIAANFEYEVSKNADWVTFVKTPNSITVTIPNYAEEEERTAEITISNEKYNISKTIKVTQSAFEPKLHVAPSEISFTADGGSQKASVTANCEYTISTTADWISYAETENGITITVPNYVEEETRSAEIIVSSEKYNISKTIKVTQAAFVPKLEISTTTTSYEYDYMGGEFTVAITSNFAYDVTTTANWVKCTKTANGITVRVLSYAEVETRSAYIIISSEKYNISKVVKVTQSGLSEEEYAKRCIIYTSSDGEIVTLYSTVVFGANIVSNTYENGKGVILFNAPVTSIGRMAFRDCSNLTSIVIPNSATEIGEQAFYYCTSLTSVTIGNSVTSIEYDAFRGCSSLTSVTIPDSVTSIGRSAFNGCSSLTSVIIGDSVTSIGEYTFYGCNSLTSVTIPDSVTSIGEYAFQSCSSLTSLTIGNSVTSIGDYAFHGCKSLSSVTIGNSITSIGDRAFQSCNSLTSVHISDLSAWCRIRFYCGEANPMYYGAKLYLNGNDLTELVIPSDIIKIKDYAFHGCKSLSSVTISDSVTSIGIYAFNGCSSLTSVTIPDSDIEIGGGAFQNCTSLKSVTIGNGVTSIGMSAFNNCSSLTSVTIPDSVTSIRDFAFYECRSLTSVTIGNSVTSIGNQAFYECRSLTSVYCKPITPPTGGSVMFYNNASGRKIYVPTASVEAYKSAEYWSSYASYIVGYDF